MPNPSDPYRASTAGIFVPDPPVEHRSAEYDEAGFNILCEMQDRHFWYLGRYRFVLAALLRHWPESAAKRAAAIDLGGACGGWVRYVQRHAPGRWKELALADSSQRALELARDVIGPQVRRYHVDLQRLGWTARWDVVFLLDVLEHLRDDVSAMHQVAAALRPGGVAVVTTPALKAFWSYNDDLVSHQRRYARANYRAMASQTGLELCTARYFMFFLSPLLWLSRIRHPNLEHMTEKEKHTLLERTHRVPVALVNQCLRAIFACETPLGLWAPFPWGTSILGIFRKPK